MSSRIGVLRSAGDGTLVGRGIIDLGDWPGGSPYITYFAMGDVNGDGLSDLFIVAETYGSLFIYLDVAVTGQDRVLVLPGVGAGKLGSQVAFPTEGLTFGLVATDFNGDGRPDIATMNGAGRISVLLNMSH